MNEKELGEALLKWDARGPVPTVDPHKLVASVLEHDGVRAAAGCVRHCAVDARRYWHSGKFFSLSSPRVPDDQLVAAANHHR